MSFVHLHVHSSFSVLDGMSKIDDLIDKSIDYGMPGIALTDHGSMYGIKEFLDYSKKVKKKAKSSFENGKISQDRYELIQKFKPIVGVEAYCATRTLYDKDKDKKLYIERKNKEIVVDRSGFHLVLLAKNKKGYHNLCKLVSISWVDGFYHKPRIDKNVLEKYSEGLIVSTACLGGEIPQLIMNDNIDKAEETIMWFKRVFGEDFYLEVQLHKPTCPGVSDETYKNQLVVNKAIFELAEKTNTKVIATNDIHFVLPEHADAHERLVCLSTGKKMSDNNRMVYSKEEYLKTPEQMKEIFADHPETISNTLEVFDKVEPFSIDSPPIMPQFDIPTDFGTLEEYKAKITPDQLIKEFSTLADGTMLTPEKASKRIEDIGGVEKLYRIKLEADYLTKLTYDGASKRYFDITDEIRERIDFELHTMKTMGFPGYFLIVQDFISAARNMGVLVGPGRGSAAGSVVAYCLQITNIDPLKFDLLFERFLNPDRISLPDIDIDFDNEGLSKVLDWVTEKYGKGCVAHIINYGTMATKLAITDVGRIQEVPLAEVNSFKNMIPDKLDNYKDNDGKSPKVNIKNIMKYCKEVQRYCNDNKQMAEVMKYAEQLEGTIRQTGVHACGIIIAPDDLTNFVPLSTAKDKNKENAEVLVTQYDGHVIEDIGLIKMDFLALKTLSILKETVVNIKKSKNIDIDIDNIDWDDKATFELFAQGNTIGIFQFESAGMRKYLRELQPTSIEDLIAMNALYRPGPMDNIPDFIDRKQGRVPIKYDIPEMEVYLKATYGITVYQEQVMLLSRLLANFTRGESDQLRKAMGKKIESLLEELKPKFFTNGQKNGYSEAILTKIWTSWVKFASYAFNKSHSTCYAILAYQMAYLKVHYPAEFMAANLTMNKGKIVEVNKFMEECKAMKIPVLLPDINESDVLFTVNDKGEIRFGLGGVKNVGSAAVDSIIQERKANGPYLSLFDFVGRVNLKSCNKKSIESLVLAGAFDLFKSIKREDYFAEETTINDLINWGKRSQASRLSLQNSLFGEEDLGEEAVMDLPSAALWSDMKKLGLEKDLIGMYLSAHPLDKYYAEINYGGTHSIASLKSLEKEMMQSLEDTPNNEVISFASNMPPVDFVISGMISKASIETSKKGNGYGVFTLEDYSAQIDLKIFNGYEYGQKYFSKYSDNLIKDLFVTVKGTVVAKAKADKLNPEKKYRSVDFKVTAIELLDTTSKTMIKNVKLVVGLYSVDDVFKETLEELYRNNPGNIPLFLDILDDMGNECLSIGTGSVGIDLNPHVINNLEELATKYSISLYVNGKLYAASDYLEKDEEESKEILEIYDAYDD